METTGAGPRRSWFYPAAALVALLVAVGGFSVTYFGPLKAGEFQGPRYLHLHATLFFGWLVLFLTQTLLVRARNIRLHRRLGVAGAVLAPLMIASGTYVAIAAATRGIAEGYAAESKAFLIVPLSDLLAFTVLVAFGLARRKQPQTHKRLMLLATAALLPPGIARALFPLGVFSTPPLTFGADVFLVAGIIHDLVTRRRIHPAYLWGGAWVVGIHALREMSGDTAAWMAVAELLT